MVAGGGPAGAICAYYLAQAGKKVILIDAQNFPRDKVCGDFISPASLKELERTSIVHLDEFKSSNIITAATISLDGKKHLTQTIPRIKELDNYGRVIPRFLLDNWIINLTKQQGVQVITPCKLLNYVTHEHSVMIECEHMGKNKRFLAKILVGADGSNSRVARILQGKKPNPNHKIIAVRAYFEQVNCIPKHAEIFFSKDNFPGYSWFFPVTKSTANVGIGILYETFPKRESNLKTLLLEAINKDPFFKARIGQNAIPAKIAGWPLSCYDPTAVNIKDRVILVGDAASLINPFSGEGIQYALQSGRFAAETIIECFKNEEPFNTKSLKRFDTQLRKEIGLDLSFGNIIIHLIRNKNLSFLWFNLLYVIYYRSRKDKQYASISGGIFVGSVPMYQLISISYVYKTIIQAMTCLFRFAHNKQVLIQTPGFIKSSVLKALEQKKAYWLWLRGILKTLFLFIKMSIKVGFMKIRSF